MILDRCSTLNCFGKTMWNFIHRLPLTKWINDLILERAAHLFPSGKAEREWPSCKSIHQRNLCFQNQVIAYPLEIGVLLFWYYKDYVGREASWFVPCLQMLSLFLSSILAWSRLFVFPPYKQLICQQEKYKAQRRFDIHVNTQIKILSENARISKIQVIKVEDIV